MWPPTRVALRLQEALKAEIERKRKAKETQFGGRKFARLADLQAHPDGDADARPAGEEATLAHASDDNQARRLCVGHSCAGSLTYLATATPQAAAASAPQASGQVRTPAETDVHSSSETEERASRADGCPCTPLPQEAPSSAIVAAAAELVQTALPKEVEGMSEGEVVRRLRLLGHPAKLFGEGHTDRLLRLHVIQQNISLQAQARVPVCEAGAPHVSLCLTPLCSAGGCGPRAAGQRVAAPDA